MIRRFIKYIYGVIKDPQRELSERVFVIFSIISEIAVLIALAVDIYIGENIGEIITLIAIVITVPLVTFVLQYKQRIRFAIAFLVTSLVFAILPALFFFGGGPEGGGILWIIFAFMYVGLVISGKWRNIILTLLYFLTIGCYVAAYYHPEWVIEHERQVFYIDSAASILLVGTVCFFMTWSQNRLIMAENARAKKEAERAEELSRSQNRFFSSMSHEIRTPINSILGLNELILRDGSASDEIIRDATGIQGSGKMLLSLINDILDFSKMEAGSMDIVPVDYRVGDMLSEIVNMIWVKAHDKGLKFDVSIDPNVPSVLYGDEVRIKQIMINLLNNAVKYTAEGSIDLHIESGEADENNTILSISISDTGMGIKKEALPYLFDAFKRVDEEKNRNIEGTGLGLSIVKQLTELMGGSITVNSVYGEGSTFTVTLKQGISDPAHIGELNIHNQNRAKRSQYESSFKAPDAKVLIVDDNEMNLEVEKKLLSATQISVDTVTSGKAALDKTIKTHYDVILMDHLMPEMNGIECLEAIRNQTGGLNRTTAVVVLTANAGSSNRELYNRSGFDGYLVKPVSGEMLEDMLIKHISRDKLILSSKMMRMREDISTTAGYARKAPVVITVTSVCDLPDAVINKLNISVIPFLVTTDEGVFKDGEQIVANELIRYMAAGGKAVSSPPDVSAYTEFFSSALRKAHHLIHIALTTSMSKDYERAQEAARSFDNVTVINSGCVSSAVGILALIANKLVQQNIPVNEIIEELETVKQRLMCSFVIDTTDYMSIKGLISPAVHGIARALNLHPSIVVKNDRSGIGNIWMGSTRRAYRNYIRKVFSVDIIHDSDVVFITSADIPMETLQWIKEEISRVAYFKRVVFQQASAAITSNCGPGTFGILYFIKSNKSYNIGSYISDDEEDEAASDSEEAGVNAVSGETMQESEEEVSPEPVKAGEEKHAEDEKPWYLKFDFLDGEQAVKNSGSEEAFRTVLKIYYDSLPDKAAELDAFYSAQDWENYTIKVHALKSGAKLVGAMELSEKAQLLENAGKEKDTTYITGHHESFMRAYRETGEKLSGYFDSEKEDDNRPYADESLMISVYEGLKEAAGEMDCDTIGEIIKELEDYRIPEAEQEKYKSVCDMAAAFDYDGILKLLS